MLQFSFSNPKIISDKLKALPAETKEEQRERKSHSSGFMIIKPIHNVSLKEIMIDLKEAGYEMVDAFCKKRNHANGKNKYYMIRFIFVQREFMDISDDFVLIRDEIINELRDICHNSSWRVRAFSNPYYEDGEEKENQRALSINFEVRTPFYLPDGNPVVVWEKDKNGNRVGDKPLPIKPEHTLKIIDNNLGVFN